MVESASADHEVPSSEPGKASSYPCSPCPNVVGLKRFDGPWGYAVEPLMPDRDTG